MTAGRHRRSRIVAKDWVVPGILRLTVSGDLDDFVDQGTDQHVALYFYPPEAMVPERLDPEVLARLHEYAAPMVRRYTIRRWDPARRQIDFDFVVHDDPGTASAWATSCAVGDEIIWWGPTAAWQPRPDTTRFVLVGDETALPAIDAILAQLPGARPPDRGLPESPKAEVVVEVDDPRTEGYLEHHADRAAITWVQRETPGDGAPALLDVVRRLGVPRGPVQVWAAAEYATVAELRSWFLGECRLSRESQAFLVTYWTQGRAQDLRPDARNRARNQENRARDPEGARRWVRPGSTCRESSRSVGGTQP